MKRILLNAWEWALWLTIYPIVLCMLALLSIPYPKDNTESE